MAWSGQGAAEALKNTKAKLVSEVCIDGLAVLQMVKHCNESLPVMVAGSLLGLDKEGTLEITHSFPCPSENPEGEGANEGIDGQEFQMEMMKMLREVNVDNNCVGWYQSMYLGSFYTNTLIENQFSYQDNLSDNSVVILYDPIQTSNGTLTLKAFRLTQAFMERNRRGDNGFIRPSEILEELPVRIRNPGLLNALVYDVTQGPGGADCTFDRLDLGGRPYLEKNLEFLCAWVDDLAAEHQKFQQHARAVAKQRQERLRWLARRRHENEERRLDGEPPLPERPDPGMFRAQGGPPRLESLLIANQINTYCAQVNRFTGAAYSKLYLAGSLHKDT
ncbi:unnamed protein product [Heterosigma akashiwo]|uniref:Eukaryotic translation initiation factor 3 subunit H n=1 Tax=Heterosigma akashiwo TaxID=2829 RepID=A0A6V1NQH4_HETAK|mmetsp:Transcript_4485/g.6352  ORF Transcript_4485/g.6352 Transcript_4485/m.6352 type:complete len:333 (+) Transcript_4485:88-1086(+)